MSPPDPRASDTGAADGRAGAGLPLPSDAVVYVIDDDVAVRRSLARLIRSVNLSVETFSSVQAFREYKGRDQPACLVLDVRLPGLGGLELQAAMGSSQRTMPIIFITGRGTVPMSVRAMKGGALDFLQKPFDGQVLLDAITRGLAVSREGRVQDTERRATEERLVTLTPRERQVMGLVVKGMLNKQIAGVLGAAEKTIKIHRGRMMKKMQAQSLPDLIQMARRVGFDVTPSQPDGGR